MYLMNNLHYHTFTLGEVYKSIPWVTLASKTAQDIHAYVVTRIRHGVFALVFIC